MFELNKFDEQNKFIKNSYTYRPFLKWVGGKRSIIKELVSRMPNVYSNYYEPFVGGGMLYFSLIPKNSHLSDINSNLVVTYNVVKNNVEALIEILKIHSLNHNPDYFKKARKCIFTEKDHLKVAAWFIYLNKTCFNGLYRVNKSGFFNVPIGSYTNPNICDEENLHLASKVLQSTTIKQQRFDQIPIENGAFYYLDPPYHKTFSNYDSSGFDDMEHEALADYCARIHKAGGFFMLSNSNTEFIQKSYKNFHIEQVYAGRLVSCKGNQRSKEKELIIRNYGSEEIKHNVGQFSGKSG